MIAEHVDGQGREYLSIIFDEELPYKAGTERLAGTFEIEDIAQRTTFP